MKIGIFFMNRKCNLVNVYPHSFKTSFEKGSIFLDNKNSILFVCNIHLYVVGIYIYSNISNLSAVVGW